jgi:PhnB protein
MTLTPYLNLTGNAEEAMTFYQSIFGGETSIMRWSEMPPNPKMPVDDAWKDKVMHGSLTINDNVSIYLSDSWVDREPPVNSVFLHVTFDSEEELRAAYAALSDGGAVNMPVDKTFWGSVYGDLVDKYGTGWGLEYEIPQ